MKDVNDDNHNMGLSMDLCRNMDQLLGNII